MTLIQEASDRQVLGVWRGAFDEDAGRHYFHFLEQDDGSIAGVWVALPHEGKRGGWVTFSLRTAVSRAHAVADVRWRVFHSNTAESDSASAIFRVLYRIQGGQLAVYLENRQAAATGVPVGSAESVRELERSRLGAAEPASAAGVSSATQDRATLGPPLIVLTRVE